MVGADGVLPLPWLADPLAQALQTQRGHALLLHGPRGVGQFELGLCLAQAWLCEASPPLRPCGICASCHLVQAHSHPDLLVLLPEALREALGWDAADGGGEGDGGPERAGSERSGSERSGSEKSGSERTSKTKPSREIKVEAVRLAVAFAQTTSARGRGKVVVLHPAERINAIAANTLLRTLEEPPGDARFVLSSAAPDALLPTIRSRCQALALKLPEVAVASAWLGERGVVEPEVLLAAAGGQPLEALEWSQQGIDATLWLGLPAAVARGDATVVAGWPLPRLIDALQKLAHDAACVAAGAAPRYFPSASIPGGAKTAAVASWSPASRLSSLTTWNRELQRISRHAEHPWNAGLMTESLVDQGRQSLTRSPTTPPPRAGAPVKSRP